MKKIIGVAVILALVLFLIPMGIRHERHQTGDAGNIPGATGMVPLPESGRTISVQMSDGTIQELDLNTYLWGVVAAEMPASFEEEALKAQAVAARTFSLRKAAATTGNHPDADVCTDYACCQAWISRTQAEANWGDNAVANANKITAAIAETGDQVILYDNQLIDAVFHSSSGDATQDAVEVWGGSVPYLQSVTSPEGDEVPNYHSQVAFTAQEFKDTFLAARPEAVLEGDPSGWIGEPVYSDSGSVHGIVIGGVEVSGAQARSIFGLRSACFSVEVSGDTITFSVTGFGHGVGMSQYGANTMAQAGSTYLEILQHYYTGVTVEDCPAALWTVGETEGNT